MRFDLMIISHRSAQFGKNHVVKKHLSESEYLIPYPNGFIAVFYICYFDWNVNKHIVLAIWNILLL